MKRIAQKYPYKAFLVPNLGIFVFPRNFAIRQIRADFKYDNIVFKFQPENTQIRHFWLQIYAFLFFREVLQLDKVEVADFKYDNSIFKILAQKYPNEAFLIPNLGSFREVLQLGKFECADFQYDNIVFKFQSQNTQTRHFWSRI